LRKQVYIYFAQNITNTHFTELYLNKRYQKQNLYQNSVFKYCKNGPKLTRPDEST